jgi:mono/diheme cytochrome c family protein
MPDELNFPQRGSLLAWDPVANEKVWEHAFEGEGRYGGTLSTAGNLVFQGNADVEFVAYNAETGEQLWDFDPQTGVTAGPITYELDGVQYVAVVPGRAADDYYEPNGSRVLVFTLGGTEVLPEPVEYTPAPINDAPQFAEAAVVDHGGELFEQNCAICHGNGAATRATFPDLRRSARLGSQEAFDSIVLDGALAENGMASFAAGVTAEDSAAIRAYVISTAQEAIARQNEAPADGAPLDTPPPGAPQGATSEPGGDAAEADADAEAEHQE